MIEKSPGDGGFYFRENLEISLLNWIYEICGDCEKKLEKVCDKADAFRGGGVVLCTGPVFVKRLHYEPVWADAEPVAVDGG